MTIAAKNRIATGFRALSQMDSGENASVLAEDEVRMAVNTTFRNGFAEVRPGLKKLTLTYPADVMPDNSGMAAQVGLFQGACVYRPSNAPECLVASISGRQFRFNVAGNLKVSEITPRFSDGTIDRNSKWRDTAYFLQAEQFLFTQDGQSPCMIYDGGQNRRANAAATVPEIPPGTVMAYVQGRVWVSRPNRRSFVAGDIVGNESSGTAAYGFKDSVFKFTENTFIYQGGDFSVPTESGQIVAMHAPPNLDTSLGQGALQVFTDRSGFSVHTPVDRSTWESLTYPIETKSLNRSGPVSHRGIADLNSDAWYRAQDGVRSFLIARRDFTMTWSNTPMSREMERVLSKDDPSLLRFASTVNFDNRLLVTCSPYRVPNRGVVFKGLSVLDTSPVTSMRGKKPPEWDGLWTGVRILQILEDSFSNVSRCFLFVLNSQDKIEVWELTKSANFDQLTFNTPVTIDAMIETRSMGFEDGGQLLKELQGVDLWRDRMIGHSTVSLAFLPDQYAFFQTWNTNGGSTSECATGSDCSTGLCASGPKQLQPQYRSRTTFGQPVDDCESISGRPYRVGYEFTFRIRFTNCRLKMFRAYASHIEEPEFLECPVSSQTCVDLAGCDDDLFSYTVGN